jgi:MFS family permease
MRSVEEMQRARALVIVMFIWGGMTLWNFGLPGLQFDEANHYAFVPGLKSEAAARLSHFRLPDNYLDEADGVRQFPIVGGSVYNSVIGAYLGLPYFLVADHSQGSLRLFTAGLVLAAILAVTVLVGRLVGWRAAVVAGAIIATDPSHVFSARAQGAPIWPVILFWALSANFLLTSARRDGGSGRAAALAGASLGLSVMSYFIGLFIALPLVAAALFIHWRNPRCLALFIGSGLVAYSPFLYAMWSIQLVQPELLRNFGVPDWAQRSSITLFGLDNLARLNRIVMGSFAAHDFAGGITGRFATEGGWLRLPAFLSAGCLGAWIVLKRRDVSTELPAFFTLVGVTVLLYLAAMFLLKATSVHHLLPLTVVVAAACAGTLAIRGPMKFLAMAVCAILLVSNLASLRNAHERLQETGGRGFHNESYTLAPRMLAGPLRDYHPVFAGWGTHLQFLFLSDGQIPYTFIWSPQPETITRLLARHGGVAVVVPHADREIVEQGFTASEVLSFQQRSGEELFMIFLLEADAQRIATD